jgi:ABC-type multidrug transport system fused ATPase/permease subunit
MTDNSAARHGIVGLVWRFLRPYAGQATIVAGLLTFQTIESLLLPSLYADVINYGVVTGNTGYIWRTGSLMFGITVLIGITAVLTTRLGTRVVVGVEADLRAAIYRRVRAFSVREVHRFGIPSLITRNTSDAEQVGLLVSMLVNALVPAVVTCVGGVFLAVRESAALSLLLVVVVPVVALAVVVVAALTIPLLRSLQFKYDRLNQVLLEQMTGVRVVRAFRRTRSEQTRFDTVNQDITTISLRTFRIYAVAGPAIVGTFALAIVAVVWFGGRLVTNGTLPIGNLAAYLVYLMLILSSILFATAFIFQMPRALASAERIGEVIDTVPAISDPEHPVVPARADGAIELRHVTFRYPGSENPVLRDLDFVTAPGQTTAVIGGSGSGKSTLIHLISRSIEPTSGTVLIDGTDVRELSAQLLWSTIGLVPQRPFLFRGTVASTLRFGAPEATDEQLWRALDVAQASDFVASMPGALDAPIDQGGTNISTGQRQRLCIARALVRRPRLYLFDDCFSALDAATEARLRTALGVAAEGATTVIVAQRIATIQHADQIIVLDNGCVSGIGTHEELLAGCATYQEMAASQIAKDIAA